MQPFNEVHVNGNEVINSFGALTVLDKREQRHSACNISHQLSPIVL